MQTIIAGRIETQERAQQVIAQLNERGVAAGDMQSFYLTPPGQRGESSMGGDDHADSAAKDAHKGQASGAAVGAVAGLVAGGIAAVAIPPLAPVILAGVTGVGALGGSVAGAVGATASAEHPKQSEAPARHGGLMVAIRVTPATEAVVLDALRAAGAKDIERAAGEWRDGQWVGFDPKQPAQTIDEA